MTVVMRLLSGRYLVVGAPGGRVRRCSNARTQRSVPDSLSAPPVDLHDCVVQRRAQRTCPVAPHGDRQLPRRGGRSEMTRSVRHASSSRTAISGTMEAPSRARTVRLMASTLPRARRET